MAGQVFAMTYDSGIARRVGQWDRRVCMQWGGGGKKWSDGVTEMNHLIRLDVESHVSEVYSPPRVTGLAKGLGLVPGMAFDLSYFEGGRSFSGDGLPKCPLEVSVSQQAPWFTHRICLGYNRCRLFGVYSVSEDVLSYYCLLTPP